MISKQLPAWFQQLLQGRYAKENDGTENLGE